MRVIFLDIDGVLNSEAHLRKLDADHRALGHHDQCECYRLEHQIDDAAIQRLNRLVAETGSKIVISSSWRKLLDPEELQRVLTEHGLVAEIVGETPDGYNDKALLEAMGYYDRIFRGHEIDAWLQKHPEVDRFVILDDESDMAMHKNRLVQIECATGLLDEHVELAIRMMSWDGRNIPKPGSSWGIHCNQEGCVETLTLSRTTSISPTTEDDYQNLCPALNTAAMFLGWSIHHYVWWCPHHGGVS